MADSMLFRSEVLQRKHSGLQGSVIVYTPAAFSLGVLLAMLSLSAAAIILIFGSYAPRSTVIGYLAPEQGLVRVLAQRPGKVDSVLVKDGDEVSFGQQLVLISSEQGWIDGEGNSVAAQILGDLSAQESRLNATLVGETDTSRSNVSRLKSRIASLERQFQMSRAELAALKKERASAEGVILRLDELHRKGFLTPVEMAIRKQQTMSLERQEHALSSALAGVESQLNDARLELEQQPLLAQRSRNALLNQISEIRRQIKSYESTRGYAVIAPVSGRVTAMQIKLGESVTPDKPLLTLVSADAVMEAHLLVPSRAVGFVTDGQEVRLRYAAFPYQHYGVGTARVAEISRTTLRPEELSIGLALTEGRVPQRGVGSEGHRWQLV